MNTPVRTPFAGVLCAAAMWGASCPQDAAAVSLFTDAASRSVVTHVAQFRELSGEDFLAGCDFRLTGVVTLVDTNRDLTVLQDDTGAVALHVPVDDHALHVGQHVTLDGAHCVPLVIRFPSFPLRPTGFDTRDSFEAPAGTGEYRLTRMRGWVRAPVTGDYRFWIASDNSSELWLGTDASPATIRRIASISRFNWVEPREWSRFPSQRSEVIPLEADRVYHIEALQEQTTERDHLAVGWRIPSGEASSIEVIDGRYLVPWDVGRGLEDLPPHGIRREYWTNYTSGNLAGLGGPRTFDSALSVETLAVHPLGQDALPTPEPISLNHPLPADMNYRWVQVEGLVKFSAIHEDGGYLEISDGRGLVRVHVSDRSLAPSGPLIGAAIRAEGVCEAVLDPAGTPIPGLIWASAPTGISLLDAASTNDLSRIELPAPAVPDTVRDMQGFYGTRGVVTFNDRIFGKDYIVVQEDTAVVLVNANGRPFADRLEVGQGVELGGDLAPDKLLPVITPIFVTPLGQRSMPRPILHPLDGNGTDEIEGRWSELEGVVHAVNTNGTLSVVSQGGPVQVWLGPSFAEEVSRYVDAAVRVRGVLLTTALGAPTLLVPSPGFLGVDEPAPENPFGMPLRTVAGILDDEGDPWRAHRVRVAGEVTYRDADSFFLQDETSGIRVRTSGPPAVDVGEAAEVLAFPSRNGFAQYLTEPLVRPVASTVNVPSRDVDVIESLPVAQRGSLIHLSARLLARKTNVMGQVLELQQRQRTFAATLSPGHGELPNILPGSQLRITGVWDDDFPASQASGPPGGSAPSRASLNILLRTPNDVVVLHGPPWWTLKRTVTLVGTLLAISLAALLWVYLLRQRLAMQRATQLTFSRQILERLEEERHRIAANLHDSLGQTLLVIKNHAMLALQGAADGDEWRDRLEEVATVASRAIEEVRRITHGLRPYQLDRLGLTQAIRALVNRASENDAILFACRVEDIDHLFGREAEIHVYRIVQEAVTNVVKHSSASEAAVVIMKRKESVTLSVRDNGCGFEAAKSADQPHGLGYGLTGFAERVRILGGTLAIDSRPGAGTIIAVEFPVGQGST